MSRCQHRGFYVAGFKVASGEAVAVLPQGRLRVVTRRSGPGEVNVNELPPGTLLDVPSVGLFAFDPKAAHGRAGRHVDLEELVKNLPAATARRWLNRLIVSRSDLAAFRFVFTHDFGVGVWPSSKGACTMMRTCRAHWSHLPEIVAQRPTQNHYLLDALKAVDDADLIHRLGADPSASISLVAVSITTLLHHGHHDRAASLADQILKEANDPSSPKFSSYGVWYELASAIGSFPLATFRKLADRAPVHPSDNVVRSFVAAIQEAPLMLDMPRHVSIHQRYEPAGIAASRDSVKAAGDHVLTHLRRLEPHVDDSSEVKRSLEILVINQRNTAAHQPVETDRTALRAELAITERDDLLADAASSFGSVGRADEVLFELARRNSTETFLLNDQRYRWIKAMHDAGEFSRDVIMHQHYTSELRAHTVPRLTKAQQTYVANDDTEHPLARFRALRHLNDPSLWAKNVLYVQNDNVRRLFLEHTPPDVLSELARSHNGKSRAHRDLWEIATLRGALPPELAIGHSHAFVRRAAVAKTESQTTIARALEDSDPQVLRAALTKSTDAERITSVVARLRTADAAVFAAPIKVAEHRLEQLTYHQLARISAERGEVVVSRAAISDLRHRDLLFDLLNTPAIAPFAAERLQQLQRSPWRRHRR